jgi:hypothetical protein
VAGLGGDCDYANDDMVISISNDRELLDQPNNSHCVTPHCHIPCHVTSFRAKNLNVELNLELLVTLMGG